MKYFRLFSVLTIVSGFLIATTSVSYADDQANWERWATHNPAETHVPDHSGYTVFLQKFGVSKKGETSMAYVAMNGHGIEFLDDYLAYLQRLPVSKLNRNEQLAYWLNLFNASVIREIAKKNTPPQRMTALRGTPGAPGKMWSKKILTVEGYDLSLEDLEMNIIARHWQSNNGNPMWIYGLNWGAKGSPPIPLEAFFGETVDRQLSDVARSFVNNSRYVRISKDKLIVSSLYSWHGPQIGQSDTDVISHLSLFAKKRLKEKLSRIGSISEYTFSWRTNIFKVGKKSSMPEATIEDNSGTMKSY